MELTPFTWWFDRMPLQLFTQIKNSTSTDAGHTSPQQDKICNFLGPLIYTMIKQNASFLNLRSWGYIAKIGYHKGYEFLCVNNYDEKWPIIDQKIYIYRWVIGVHNYIIYVVLAHGEAEGWPPHPAFSWNHTPTVRVQLITWRMVDTLLTLSWHKCRHILQTHIHTHTHVH